MATVHRAIERGIEGFERVVALKRLLPHLAEDEDFVRAFVREAKLASLLQHGNIVQLYELGRVGASYFISMEYIPGRDLRAHPAPGAPGERAAAGRDRGGDPDRAARRARLRAQPRGADGKPLGLVHRDISPSNLIVSHTGHLKVIDFGIAKATLGHLMTHTGRIKGKLSYMAPEALAGQGARRALRSVLRVGHRARAPDRARRCSPPGTTSRPSTGCRTWSRRRRRSRNPELPGRARRDRAARAGRRIRPSAGARRPRCGRRAGRARHRPAPPGHQPRGQRVGGRGVRDAGDPRGCACRWPRRRPVRAAARAASSAHGDADDEIMDMVWGVTTPRSPIPALLDEPDVSGRFSQVSVWRAGAGTLAPAPAAAPSATVSGTSRARPRRRSMLPLMLAAVAVSAAGAAMGWLVASERDPSPPVAAVLPPVVQPPAWPRRSPVAPGPTAENLVPDSAPQSATDAAADRGP